MPHYLSNNDGTNGINGINGINGVNGINGINDHTQANGSADPQPRSSIPIAIIGMACRFGGDVSSPSELWELCATGKDGWCPIPEQRFNVKSLYHKDKTKIGRVYHHLHFVRDRAVLSKWNYRVMS